jgi:nucleotide-binding universal stress UspA family protein
MSKLLVAIDGSQCSQRAVEYVARQFSGLSGLEITLFHVLPYVPAVFWDDGHIKSSEEVEARKKLVDLWLANQTSRLDPIFHEAAAVLTKGGIRPEQITVRSVSDSIDAAGSIIEEAKTGGYQTVVMGRCGRTAGERLLMGSVTTKVINYGTGMALCVVE